MPEYVVLGIYNYSATAANVSGRREMGVGLNCSNEENKLFLIKLRKTEFDKFWLELDILHAYHGFSAKYLNYTYLCVFLSKAD